MTYNEAIFHWCRECGTQDTVLLRSQTKRKCQNCGAVGGWRRRQPLRFIKDDDSLV
ncbi:MAG: hypothetical protein ACW987_15360 [Candidatus Thorarchaeota archaeon]